MNDNNKIYFIPEYQADNPQFYAKDARLIDTHLIMIEGYELWGFVNNINHFSYPYTIVAVPSPEKASYFYRVSFENKKDNFNQFGLEVDQDKSVIYMSSQELSKHIDAFPIPNQKWTDVLNQYNALTAFCYLGIIPTLTSSIFTDLSSFPRYEHDLHQIYQEDLSLNTLLNHLYADVLNALDIFGFTQPVNQFQSFSINYAHLLAENQTLSPFRSSYAFGNIKFAIENYHIACFHCSRSTFTIDTFKSLIASFKYVTNFLHDFGYEISDENPKQSLLAALNQYKVKNKIRETLCGPKVITSMISSSLPSISFGEIPKRSEQITKIFLDSNIYNESNYSSNGSSNENSTLIKTLIEYQKIANEIDKMHQMNEIEQKLERAVAISVGRTRNICELLSERVETVIEKASKIDSSLKTMIQLNEKIENNLSNAEHSVVKILNEHSKLQQKMIKLRSKMAKETRIERFIIILYVILFIFIVHKLMQFLFA